ncbi:MAG: hypothetical protein Q9191_008134 [Dirinaria sp. TL-2023a]
MDGVPRDGPSNRPHRHSDRNGRQQATPSRRGWSEWYWRDTRKQRKRLNALMIVGLGSRNRQMILDRKIPLFRNDPDHWMLMAGFIPSYFDNMEIIEWKPECSSGEYLYPIKECDPCTGREYLNPSRINEDSRSDFRREFSRKRQNQEAEMRFFGWVREDEQQRGGANGAPGPAAAPAAPPPPPPPPGEEDGYNLSSAEAGEGDHFDDRQDFDNYEARSAQRRMRPSGRAGRWALRGGAYSRRRRMY